MGPLRSAFCYLVWLQRGVVLVPRGAPWLLMGDEGGRLFWEAAVSRREETPNGRLMETGWRLAGEAGLSFSPPSASDRHRSLCKREEKLNPPKGQFQGKGCRANAACTPDLPASPPHLEDPFAKLVELRTWSPGFLSAIYPNFMSLFISTVPGSPRGRDSGLGSPMSCACCQSSSSLPVLSTHPCV